MLDSNGRLPQNLLLAGYDKYSAYDLAWQSLHMAAAAACRGSTASGGSGSWHNSVRVRNIPGKKTCAQICLDSGHFRHCDAEVSIYGKKRKGHKEWTGSGRILQLRMQAPVVQRPDKFIRWIRHSSASKIYFTLNVVQGFRTLPN